MTERITEQLRFQAGHAKAGRGGRQTLFDYPATHILANRAEKVTVSILSTVF